MQTRGVWGIEVSELDAMSRDGGVQDQGIHHPHH